MPNYRLEPNSSDTNIYQDEIIHMRNVSILDAKKEAKKLLSENNHYDDVYIILFDHLATITRPE